MSRSPTSRIETRGAPRIMATTRPTAVRAINEHAARKSRLDLVDASLGSASSPRSFISITPATRSASAARVKDL